MANFVNDETDEVITAVQYLGYYDDEFESFCPNMTLEGESLVGGDGCEFKGKLLPGDWLINNGSVFDFMSDIEFEKNYTVQ